MQGNKSNQKSKSILYLKYSGIAFQMAAVILVSFFAGKWIDTKLGNTNPYVGMLFVLIGFIAYVYKLYIELSNERK
jgi:F0F1-type ATP synthase assembly protein I